jgi:hypothetical protein
VRDSSEYRPLSDLSHRSDGSLVDPARAAAAPPNLLSTFRSGRNPQYQVDPYVIPPDSIAPPSQSVRRSPSSNLQSSSESGLPPSVSPATTQPAHVYVVHHDAGRPPVTVYTAQGTQVVELPPRYVRSPSSDGATPPSEPQRDDPRRDDPWRDEPWRDEPQRQPSSPQPKSAARAERR